MFEDEVFGYQDPKKPDPCLWVRDLEDWFSETGKKCVEQIRKVCPCADCTERRKK